MLLAQAEHSISQPAVGSAHSAYRGIQPNIVPTRLKKSSWPQYSVNGLAPLSRMNRLTMTPKPIIVAMPISEASSGPTSSAVASFDSTVSRSDTGSDFQNSTLRSLRSSYRQPSR